MALTELRRQRRGTVRSDFPPDGQSCHRFYRPVQFAADTFESVQVDTSGAWQCVAFMVLVAVVSNGDNGCFHFERAEMFDVKRIDEIANGLTLGEGMDFLAEPDRMPIDSFNKSLKKNAAEITRELEPWKGTVQQAQGITIAKIQTLREERQQRLLTLFQQRVKFAEQRLALIQKFKDVPEANLQTAQTNFDKAWQAAEKALRKAGISDAVEAVFKVNVRQTERVQEAQAAVDAAARGCQRFAALRDMPDEAGNCAAFDLVEFVRHQLS